MSYRIEIGDTSVKIIREKDHRRMWDMRITDLPHTIEGDISEWVHHLNEKSWADSNLLYEFANVIQMLHPGNNINWYKTFSIIERSEYLDQSFKMKQVTENKSEEDHDSLLERIRFGQESFNEEEIKQVQNILVEKLKKYNLPYTIM